MYKKERKKKKQERTDNQGKLSCKLEQPQIFLVMIYAIIRLKLRDAIAETGD